MPSRPAFGLANDASLIRPRRSNSMRPRWRRCRMIEAADETPSLSKLAKAVGLSVHHFHRIFKAVSGLTPREYAAAHRTKRVQNELKRSNTVTEAIYAAGFNSGGRFYAQSDDMLGMTPTAYRAGGTNAEIHFAVG